MLPVQPIVIGEDLPVTVIARDQPEYIPLPAFIDSNGVVLTRWKLTWREILKLCYTQSLYLEVLTFRKPLQPVRLSVDPPKFETVETVTVRR